MKTFLFIGIVDEYVIKDNNDKLSKNGLKDMIYEDMKGGWGIDETKRHHPELVVALLCLEDYFMSVLFLNADLMIPWSKIKLGKYKGSM